MAQWLKQSTAYTDKLGPFVDSTDGNAEETALSIAQADIKLSKNGGTLAQSNNSAGATHDAAGWYGVPLDTTDTNTIGKLIVSIHKTGALPVWKEYFVLPPDLYDAMVSTTWAGNIADMFNGTGYVGGTAILKANATQVNGTAQTAGDLAALITTVDTVVDGIETHVHAIDGHITADYTATEKAAIDLLDDVDGGLADIHTVVNDLHTDVADVHTDVGTVITNVGDVHATDLPAVMTMLTNIHDTDLPAVKSDTAAILADTGTDGVVVAAASKTGYALSSAGVQAIWDALSSALTSVGSIGKRLVDYVTGDTFARIGAPTGASISADIAAVKSDSAAILEDTGTTLPGTLGTIAGYVDTEIAAILADTNEIQTDLANGGRLDLLIDGIKVKTDAINFTGGYVDAQVKAQDNLDFGALQKASLNAATPAVTVSDKAGFALSAAAIDGILEEVVEGSVTMRQALMLFLSSCAGKASGGGTTSVTFRDIGDTKNRIVMTVDSAGNRSAVTLDVT